MTITTGNPWAATRSASTSASCLELAYAIPRCPALNGWLSSAVPRALAGPIAATEDVWTTRVTPAVSASSITTRVPFTFTSKTASRLPDRIEVVPAR